jgi:hypothetical protein
MSNAERLDLDPATLAENAALQIVYGASATEANIEDTERLNYLDEVATGFQLTQKNYWVETNRAISMPLRFERYEEVTLLNFFKLNFEGNFCCYSRVVIGKILDSAGVRSVDALCLTFDEATLMPYMDNIPEGHLLYVPVLAIDNIDQVN